jgi:hypothetical protein
MTLSADYLWMVQEAVDRSSSEVGLVDPGGVSGVGDCDKLGMFHAACNL